MAFLEMMMKGLYISLIRFTRSGTHLYLTGNPEYGCFISHEKTRTNFEFGSSDPLMVTEPDQKCQEKIDWFVALVAHGSDI